MFAPLYFRNLVDWLKRGRGLGLIMALLAISTARPVVAKVFDGGVDSNNLGKGEWVYVLNNYFGSYAPGVTSVPAFMAYCATNLHCQFVVIKAGTGSTNYPSAANPQFTSSVVDSGHAWGLKVFGYTRSYGIDVPGEIAIANYVFGCGADGFVLDAEAEWESSTAVGTNSKVGTNGPALAMQLGGGIKTNWPTKFLAHAPLPIISYHSTFPYQQFGYWCDAVMPQDYWVDFGKTPTATVQWMDTNWGPWQSALTGMWTNAIKPLAPIGQADNPSQPGTDITEFANYLATDPGCVTAGGYHGCLFYTPGSQTPVMLAAIAGASFGAGSPPLLTSQPQSLAVLAGQNAAFTAAASGTAPFSCQWQWNGQAITGATALSYTRTNVTLADTGAYTLTVSNAFGIITSSNAVLTVLTNIVVPANIVVDNTNATFTTTGSWTQGTSSADKYGPSYEYAGTVAGSATATATFTPTITLAGDYDVSIWYPAGGNRTTNAPWSVVAAGGTLNTLMNQQVNGGQWVRLATNMLFNAGTGGFIQVANHGGPSVVLANAVQLSYSAMQPPIITLPPQTQTAWLGAPVTFSVQAIAYGAATLGYQWKFNGTNLPAATTGIYTITNVQSYHAGNYAVNVTNAVGSVTSPAASLTVAVPVLTFNGINLAAPGLIHLQLCGSPVAVILQKSTDLVTWVPLATGSLTNGTLDFYDSTTNTAVFYRARTSP